MYLNLCCAFIYIFCHIHSISKFHLCACVGTSFLDFPDSPPPIWRLLLDPSVTMGHLCPHTPPPHSFWRVSARHSLTSPHSASLADPWAHSPLPPPHPLVHLEDGHSLAYLRASNTSPRDPHSTPLSTQPSSLLKHAIVW
jgi:hypothetical protein